MVSWRNKVQMVYPPKYFWVKSFAMKNIKSKKLNKTVNTICDFNNHASSSNPTEETTLGTDPTNTTMTIITTVNTHFGVQKLTI